MQWADATAHNVGSALRVTSRGPVERLSGRRGHTDLQEDPHHGQAVGLAGRVSEAGVLCVPVDQMQLEEECRINQDTNPCRRASHAGAISLTDSLASIHPSAGKVTCYFKTNPRRLLVDIAPQIK